jgi:hypothetical protein
MDKECAYLVPDRGQRCGLTRRLLLLLLLLLLNLKHNLNVLVLAASTLEEDTIVENIKSLSSASIPTETLLCVLILK